MKLTSATDFSFRLLIHLAINQDRWVPVSEIADAYQLSHHHLAKISKTLIKNNILTTKRGREGGLRLTNQPSDIKLATIIEIIEPEPTLVNCSSGIGGTCKILPACHLKGILAQARTAFFQVLHQHTLADLIPDQKTINTLKKLLT